MTRGSCPKDKDFDRNFSSYAT